MTIEAQIPVVREALGVSSSYDTVTIPAGIRRAIAFMLRTWSFPSALTRVNVPIALNEVGVALPATGVGKIRAVRLSNGAGLYKRLRRTLIGELPYSGLGPEYYWQEGNTLLFDSAMPEAGHSVDVWYNSTNVDAADAWITADFEDIVFTLSTMRLAAQLRKPEVYGVFAPAWQEMIPTLAQYLNEVEFNDLAINMQPHRSHSQVDRYGG